MLRHMRKQARYNTFTAKAALGNTASCGGLRSSIINESDSMPYSADWFSVIDFAILLSHDVGAKGYQWTYPIKAWEFGEQFSNN